MSKNGHKEIKTLADLTPDLANARKHNPRNVGMLVDSLHQVGAARSIVVDEDGVVLAGNATIEAAAEAGIHKVRSVEADGNEIIAVVRRGLTKEQKTKLALYDNRVAELAEWNPDILSELVDTDVLSGMFSDKELAEILTQTGVEPKDAEPQIDKAEELRQKWGTETGQLWVVGNHRLLVGDSSQKSQVSQLVGNQRPAVCFTSPPYAQQRDYKTDISDWDGLMRGVFSSLPLSDEGQVLVNLGLIHRDGEWVPYWDGWIEWMRSQGWRRFGWYVWDQGSGLPGDWNGRLAPSHEFIWHFNKQSIRPDKTIATKDATRARRGKNVPIGFRKEGGSQPCTSPDKIGQDFKIPDSVIRILRSPIDGRMHPGTFPLALPDHIFRCWPGDVYDPFVGSGTTLVAAENLNRKCYAIEISPAYVGVCLERMSNAFPHLKIEKAEQARAA